MRRHIIAAIILGGVARLKGQEANADPSMADCPMMKEHEAMNQRGDKAMGFSQEKTTHHFRLAADGGTIEVSANDPTDAASQGQIRGHLGHVAKMFEHGNFEIPMLVHSKRPDGAKVMQEEKANIHYTYEQTKSGGLVRIQTQKPEALKAVHEFLRFQIREHRTGDAMEFPPKA